MIRVIFVSLVCVLVLGACRDECDPAADLPSCEGNVLVTCPQPGVDQIVPIRISRDDCGSAFCVADGPVGLCALSSSPSPLCADAGESVCESDTSRVRCASGYATSRDDCLECEMPDGGTFATCTGGPGSKCTADSQCVPALRCSANGFCFRPEEG